MKIIVQKFGGTSVASEEARVAVKNKVQQAIRNGYSPVVVVSAMGRKGAPYATDARDGYDDVLRRNHFRLRNGSNAAKIRCQRYGAHRRPGRYHH